MCLVSQRVVMYRVYVDQKVIHISNEKSFRAFCREFKEVNAAGGLVENEEGAYLFIRRNGLWDLPKGHQEEGESICDTALREVEEECGITGLELGELLCITHHCYFRDGIWHLKHSWWYAMKGSKKQSRTPQTEEGISDLVWVSRNEVPSLLSSAYSSICELFSSL